MQSARSRRLWVDFAREIVAFCYAHDTSWNAEGLPEHADAQVICEVGSGFQDS